MYLGKKLVCINPPIEIQHMRTATNHKSYLKTGILYFLPEYVNIRLSERSNVKGMIYDTVIHVRTTPSELAKVFGKWRQNTYPHIVSYVAYPM